MEKKFSFHSMTIIRNSWEAKMTVQWLRFNFLFPENIHYFAKKMDL